MKTDMELKKDVEEELDFEPSVNAAHIGVAANNGVVTLSGHVRFYAEKFAAEELPSASMASKPLLRSWRSKCPAPQSELMRRLRQPVLGL